MTTATTRPGSPVATPTGGLHGTAVRTLLAAGRSVAEARGRADLVERLDTVGRRVGQEQARTLVIGEYKAGKTTLVNALLAAPVLPVDAHLSTTVPTIVSHATTPSVRLVRPGADADAAGEAADGASLAAHVTEAGNPRNQEGWAQAEVRLPRKLLATGLALVDTPGGLGAPASMTTMAELPSASAVVLVSDAARELTASELELLRTATEHCPTVALVLTRIDLHPQWRRIAEADREHLERAGLDVTVFPVSAALRLHAAATGEEELDAETGLVPLVQLLAAGVAAGHGRRRARFVADEVVAVGEQLALEVRTELTALDDPAVAHRLADEAREARVRVHALRDKASRWQQTLNDGVADLVSDIEYDLRDRLRAVTVDAEAALDDTDPAKTWDQFAPWLHERVTQGTSTNVLWAEERTRFLADRVATMFAVDGEGALPSFDLGGRTGIADPVGLLAAPDHEKFGLSQSLMIGMRGSYGGVLMIGMVTTVAGMALLNPFSLGAGLLLGSKTLLDERKRARRRRQSEAKAAVRRHVDDVVFRVGKNSRDMLREVQRTLRDHFTRTAKELEVSLSAQIAAANTAIDAQSDELGRARRQGEVRAELARLDAVLAEAVRLRGTTEPAAGTADAGTPDAGTPDAGTPDAPVAPALAMAR